MNSKYFLLTVSDDSYTKDGVFKPWFNHYFRGVDGKVTVRGSKVKMCEDIDDVALNNLPRVDVHVKEVNSTKDGKTNTFIVLEKVVIL